MVRLDDPAAGLRALADSGIPARVTRTLADRGLYLTELRADVVDLETVFLELTGATTASGGTGEGDEPATAR